MNEGQKTLLDILPDECPERTALEALNENKHYCPQCKKNYKPNFAYKHDAFESGTHIDREQWLTGLCSDKCWKDYLGGVE